MNMEKNQSVGFAVESIELLECFVGNIQPAATKEYSLGLTQFERQTDGKHLKAITGFDLMTGIDKPACTFTCKFSIEYSAKGESTDWSLVKDHIIVAHVLPFIREFMWNITMRMPIDGVMIHPVNAHQLVDRFRAARGEPPQNIPEKSPQ